jgi:hypothetical protein
MRVDKRGVLWQEDGRVGTDVIKRTTIPIGKPLEGVIGLTKEEALHFVLIVKSQIEEEKREAMAKREAKVKAKLWKIEQLLREVLIWLEGPVLVEGEVAHHRVIVLEQLRKAVDKYDRAKAKKAAKSVVGGKG